MANTGMKEFLMLRMADRTISRRVSDEIIKDIAPKIDSLPSIIQYHILQHLISDLGAATSLLGKKSELQ